MYLASHRLFLNIFGGNKIQNGQIAWFIGYTSLWQALWDSSRKQTGFHKMVQWWFNAGYVFYWLIPFSKARSLWCCCEYNRFLVNNFALGPVQEVKKVEVIEQPCLFGFLFNLCFYPRYVMWWAVEVYLTGCTNMCHLAVPRVAVPRVLRDCRKHEGSPAHSNHYLQRGGVTNRGVRELVAEIFTWIGLHEIEILARIIQELNS